MTQSGFVKATEGNIYWVLDRATVAPPGPRPTLLFIHAGVADLSMWDAQARHFTARGWHVLRFDLLGYGQSTPSPAWVEQSPRPPVDAVEHARLVVGAALPNGVSEIDFSNRKIVPIGCSKGGKLAVDFALEHPHLVAGVASIAGALSGFDHPSNPGETALEAREDAFLKAGDAQAAAKASVRYWGDGPLQPEGRLQGELREKLLEWAFEIASRDIKGLGGREVTWTSTSPRAAQRLADLQVPVAVGIGRLDESWVIAAMRYLGQKVAKSTVQEFDAAHVPNLECTDNAPSLQKATALADRFQLRINSTTGSAVGWIPSR